MKGETWRGLNQIDTSLSQKLIAIETAEFNAFSAISVNSAFSVIQRRAAALVEIVGYVGD